MFKKIIILLTFTLMTNIISAEMQLNYKNDSELYLAHNLWYEKSKMYSINYKKGKIIAVGTKVTNVRLKKNAIIFMAGKTKFSIKYQPEYWGNMNIVLFVDRLFTLKNLKDLTKDLSTKDVLSIKKGYVRKGMSRNAVILALGYPPVHATPALDLTTWTYWISRFVHKKLFFDDNGKVSQDFIPY